MGQAILHSCLPVEVDDENSAAVTTDAVGSGHLAVRQGPQLDRVPNQLDRVPN